MLARAWLVIAEKMWQLCQEVQVCHYEQRYIVNSFLQSKYLISCIFPFSLSRLCLCCWEKWKQFYKEEKWFFCERMGRAEWMEVFWLKNAQQVRNWLRSFKVQGICNSWSAFDGVRGKPPLVVFCPWSKKLDDVHSEK